MGYIRIANPDETLKKWESIRKRLYDISREIANAEIKVEIGGAGQDGSKEIYAEVTNKDEFLEAIESANYHITRAVQKVGFSCPRPKIKLKEE